MSPHTAIDTLSHLERAVLDHMALGLSHDYIARCIGIEDTDIISYIITSINVKLGIQASKNENLDRARAAFVYLASI